MGKWAILLLGFVLVVGGCAPKQVAKDWVPTSGSRSDATVKLSFEYNPLIEAPQVNDSQALEAALRRCKSWGYENVEPFGGHVENCAQYQRMMFGESACIRAIVTKEFQCLGRGDSSLPSEKK